MCSQPHVHRDGMGACWPRPNALHGNGALWASGMVYLAGRAHSWTSVAHLEREAQSSKVAAAVQVGRGFHVLNVISQDHSQELQSSPPRLVPDTHFSSSVSTVKKTGGLQTCCWQSSEREPEMAATPFFCHSKKLFSSLLSCTLSREILFLLLKFHACTLPCLQTETQVVIHLLNIIQCLQFSVIIADLFDLVYENCLSSDPLPDVEGLGTYAERAI